MLSSRLCFSISKACWALASLERASASWVCALSSRSSRTSTMPPDLLSYTAASGAPASPSLDWCVLCTKAVSLEASAWLNMAALTITSSACTTVPALWTCTRAAPPDLANSLSSTAMARRSVSIVAASSFSSASKSPTSSARIFVADWRSLSSFAIWPASSSVFSVRELMDAISFAILASSSATSLVPVLISNPRFTAVSLHQVSFSALSLAASSVSWTIDASIFDISSSTLPIGALTLVAWATPSSSSRS
mmetsp:Transcript_1452/g.3633  ORF Transcript_1452/g.3633 Transcript_1452/m.3633 type:complete len:251 (-) Transcript_1452:96-848(-)